MSLENQINADIKQAMLAKKKEELEALRAIKSAVLLLKTSPEANGGEITEAMELSLLDTVCDSSANILEGNLAMSGTILLDSGIEDVARKLGLPVETEPDEDENGPFAFKVIRLGGVEALQIDDEYVPEELP